MDAAWEARGRKIFELEPDDPPLIKPFAADAKVTSTFNALLLAV